VSAVDRAEIAAEVARRHPVDERERTSIDRFLLELDRLDEPFSERSDPTHVTASAIIVGVRGVVLHKHKRLGLWLQPGGHIDPGEAPWQAAVREAQEETGLPVVPLAGPTRPALVHVDVHPGPRGHTHLDLRYVLVADDVEPAPGAGESQDVRWFSWDDAIALSDPGLAGILRALAPSDAGTVVVRRAEAADATAVAELYLRSRRHAVPTVVSPHTDDDVRAWVAAHLVPEQETWVAELAGVVVGVLTLSAAPRGSGLVVDQLYLDPPWIGRGVGAVLVDHAKQRSDGGLELWTFQVNAAARRFYARQGFVEVDWTDGAANEEHEPDVRCRWVRRGSVRSPPS
jgi:8-oxo-dGTP pyrophosphatase MutT (NUDIX family)/N-acetylglutamate synthase-like GNAT family acetyltransferase